MGYILADDHEIPKGKYAAILIAISAVAISTLAFLGWKLYVFLLSHLG